MKMTWFEFYTKSPEMLELLISQAVDDALEAKGCSYDLKLPFRLSSETDPDVYVSWADYLKQKMP